MENIQWIFSGIGTELIINFVSLAVGAIVGGTIGYKIGSKNKVKQFQKAGDDALQKQIGSVNYYGTEQAKSDSRR